MGDAFLGERVRARRSQLGMTQDELARETKMSRCSITNIEIGNSDTRIFRLVDLCTALETTPNYLLGYNKRP